MVFWAVLLLLGTGILLAFTTEGTSQNLAPTGKHFLQTFGKNGIIVGPFIIAKIHADFISGSGWVYTTNTSRTLSFEFGPYGNGSVSLRPLIQWRRPINDYSDYPDRRGDRIGVAINHFFGTVQYNTNRTIIDGWCINVVMYIEPLIILPNAQLFSTEDSSVNALYPEQNYGTAESLEVANANGSETARSFLKFNVSGISSQSIVNYALLELDYYGYEGDGEPAVGAYRVNGGWEEENITWQNQPTVSSFYEYANELLPNDTWPLRWDITNLGREWINGTTPNNGVALRLFTPYRDDLIRRLFRSREFPDEDARPVLLLSINVPPNAPEKPAGQVFVQVGEESNYTTMTTDMNEDRLYYLFDWGDNTSSGWIGPYQSGIDYATASHHWDTAGTYQVRAKAKDTWGLESGWSDTRNVTVTQR